ncbi:MAG: aminomethyl-transferring glycine dehydrogenase subunit GcvPB, partial [Deinococcus sp.]|nr:aminomethyl-transferring glycine dehydrogenase subunit GcvPB [Deinococcus sp.]
MLTNPNTLGLFERHILDITHLARQAGVQLYYDGANLNAIVGRARPGDMGFDVVHFNLHKTFSTPHGGGGPGAGPVGVKKHLAPFLPVPTVAKGPQGYYLDLARPQSIGQVRSFCGNVGNLVRAYAYIRAHGPEGLHQVSGMAVLNANYLLARLAKTLPPAARRRCMHEFVLSAGEKGQALRIAKRLLDYGFHPPTIYFPLIVREALMIEPTETETLETLDEFAAAIEAIVREDPATLDQAPTSTVVGRLDEASAARHPVLRWRPEE